eukprot:508530_1
MGFTMLLMFLSMLSIIESLNFSHMLNQLGNIEKESMKLITQYMIHEGLVDISNIAETRYEEICDNLHLESDECYDDCMPYLFPMVLFSDIYDINDTNDMAHYLTEDSHSKLKSIFSWYEFSGGPIGHFSVGNPSMCQYFDGTYCSTPLKIHGHGQYEYHDLTLIAHGCCIPGTCSGNDAIKILKSNDWCYKSYITKYDKLFNFTSNNDISVYEICEPLERDLSYTNIGLWVICMIFMAFLLAVIITSIIHQYRDEFNNPNCCPNISQLFVSTFSLQRSWKVFTAKRRSEKSKFNYFDGIRVISILWIITFHVDQLALLYAQLSNIMSTIPLPEDSEDTMVHGMHGHNGHYIWSEFSQNILQYTQYAVDSFFYLSGFLSVFKGLGAISIWTDIPLAYLHRIVRIMPMFAFVIFIEFFISDQLSYGYNTTTRNENYNYCSADWYKMLFMYGNFTQILDGNGNINCMGVGWYICADMQMFLLVPWIILIFKHKQIYGLMCSLLLVLICIICRIYLTVYYHFSAHVNVPAYDYINGGQLIHPPGNQLWKPWNRMSPYFIAIFTMFLIRIINDRNKNFQIKSSIIYLSMLALSQFIMSCLIFWPYQDTKHLPNNRWPLINHQIYFTLSRPMWGVALSLMSFAFYFKSNEKRSIIQKLLSLPMYQPIGKLVFLMYLLHVIIIKWFYNSSQIMDGYFQTNTIIYYGLATYIVALMFAFILWFVMENPIANLSKILLRYIKKIITIKSNRKNNTTNVQTSEEVHEIVPYKRVAVIDLDNND